uniref:Exocyst complex component 7 n=1 Tax=Schistosoma haematobium TaxID=6185 RepID=A0A095CD31_SCHHA
MERIKDALAYFQENNPQDIEFSRLTSLYSIGLGSLEREFDGLLRQTFRPIDDATLIRLMDQKVSDKESGDGSLTEDTEQIEDIPNNMLNSLRFLAKWMSENQSFVNKPQGISQGCLTKYCECRRELIRLNLVRNQDFCRQTYVVALNVNAVRLINEAETDELDSEHYAIALGVLVKLMQNECILLDRLQLTASPQDSQVLLFNIFKNGSSDILTEGTTLTRLMHRAQGRAESHMVMSLLVVLKKFFQISDDLVSVLQGVDNVLIDFNQLVLRLLSQSKITLETYVQFLQQVTEKSSSNSNIVPEDGTIHELTTNVINAIFALMTNLERKSEVYSEEIRRMIFQMNNIQYILKSIYKTNIHRYLLSQDREAVAKITSILDERKLFYTRCCADILHLRPFPESCGSSSIRRRRASQFGSVLLASVLSPNLNTNHHKHSITNNEQSQDTVDEHLTKIDQKERSFLKSLWNDFNNGLSTLTKQHHLISIPDRELKNSLEHQLVRDLVALYRGFWEKSMSIAFTTNRDKYIKLSVEEFEIRIRHLFNGTSTNSTRQ